MAICSCIVPARRLTTSSMEEPFAHIIAVKIFSRSKLQDLIPNVLRQRKIWSADAKVVAQKNSNGQKNKLTLMLCWDEDDRQMSMLSQHSQSSQKSCSPKPTHPVKDRKPGKFLTCDGPCREKKHPREVHSLGRCDHYICDFCYKIHHNPDGIIVTATRST